MYVRSVSIISHVIGIAWGEVEASSNLLIEQNIFHWFGYVGVESNCEFTNVSCPFIRIQNLVYFTIITSSCLDDLSLFKFESYVIENGSMVQGFGIELYMPFH